jgi:hypothetical protein
MLTPRMMNAGPTNAKETLFAAAVAGLGDPSTHGPPGGYGGGSPDPFGGGGGGGYGGGYGGPPVGPPGFGPPGGFPPPGGPMTPGGAPEVNTTRPLIMNLLSVVCLFWGVLSFPVAVVGVVFSVQAMNAQKVGDLSLARAKAKLGTILALVSYGLAAAAAVVAVVVFSS